MRLCLFRLEDHLEFFDEGLSVVLRDEEVEVFWREGGEYIYALQHRDNRSLIRLLVLKQPSLELQLDIRESLLKLQKVVPGQDLAVAVVSCNYVSLLS